MSKQKPVYKSWVVLSDIQIPFQDPKALSVALKFADLVKPWGVILNGDIVDCYAISDYDKDPAKIDRYGLNREISEVQGLLKSFDMCTEKVWIMGNHEDRWRRLLWRHPAISNLTNLTFEKVFLPVTHGFTVEPYGGYVRLGKLMVTHGFLVRQHSGISAKAHFERLGNSVLVGHTHRLGAYYKTDTHGPHVALENGCLCLKTPEYAQFPNWQHGFTYVTVDEATGHFVAQQIPILPDYTILFGRETIR